MSTMVYVRRKGHCYTWRCERTAADDYRAFLLVLAFVRLSSPWRALIARVSWRAFAMDAFGLLMTRAVRVPRVPPIGALHFLFASASAALRPDTVTSLTTRGVFCFGGAFFFFAGLGPNGFGFAAAAFARFVRGFAAETRTAALALALALIAALLLSAGVLVAGALRLPPLSSSVTDQLLMGLTAAVVVVIKIPLLFLLRRFCF